MNESIDVKYNFVFPSLIVYKDSQDLINSEIIEESELFLSKCGDNPFHSYCTSTVNSSIDILFNDKFKQIKDFIEVVILSYISILKFEHLGLKIKGSWMNGYDERGYQDLHHHHDSLISGVFYIKSDGYNDLMFQAPHHFFQPSLPKVTETNLENCNNIFYESYQGRCIVFPSHLMHRTLPAKSRRISLSFNVGY